MRENENISGQSIPSFSLLTCTQKETHLLSRDRREEAGVLCCLFIPVAGGALYWRSIALPAILLLVQPLSQLRFMHSHSQPGLGIPILSHERKGIKSIRMGKQVGRQSCKNIGTAQQSHKINLVTAAANNSYEHFEQKTNVLNHFEECSSYEINEVSLTHSLHPKQNIFTASLFITLTGSFLVLKMTAKF